MNRYIHSLMSRHTQTHINIHAHSTCKWAGNLSKNLSLYAWYSSSPSRTTPTSHTPFGEKSERERERERDSEKERDRQTERQKRPRESETESGREEGKKRVIYKQRKTKMCSVLILIYT